MEVHEIAIFHEAVYYSLFCFCFCVFSPSRDKSIIGLGHSRLNPQRKKHCGTETEPMGLQCCMGGTTLQTLKLAAIPTLSYSCFVCRPVPKTTTPDLFLLRRHGRSRRPSFPPLARALSAPAMAFQTATNSDEKGDADSHILGNETELVNCYKSYRVLL